MSKLTEAIRKMDCSGDLAETVAIFELAYAVDRMEQDHANAIAVTIKLMDENHDLKEERDALAAELAALREQKPLTPHLYWYDSDIGYDSPDDFELIGKARIGDLFVIGEAYYFNATYRVIKEYDEDGEIEPEVERISGVNIYDDVGRDASITDAELKLIMDARAFREKMASVDATMARAEAVFAAPEEYFDWPEDRGEHPQRGVAK